MPRRQRLVHAREDGAKHFYPAFDTGKRRDLGLPNERWLLKWESRSKKQWILKINIEVISCFDEQKQKAPATVTPPDNKSKARKALKRRRESRKREAPNRYSPPTSAKAQLFVPEKKKKKTNNALKEKARPVIDLTLDDSDSDDDDSDYSVAETSDATTNSSTTLPRTPEEQIPFDEPPSPVQYKKKQRTPPRRKVKKTQKENSSDFPRRLYRKSCIASSDPAPLPSPLPSPVLSPVPHVDEQGQQEDFNVAEALEDAGMPELMDFDGWALDQDDAIANNENNDFCQDADNLINLNRDTVFEQEEQDTHDDLAVPENICVVEQYPQTDEHVLHSNQQQEGQEEEEEEQESDQATAQVEPPVPQNHDTPKEEPKQQEDSTEQQQQPSDDPPPQQEEEEKEQPSVSLEQQKVTQDDKSNATPTHAAHEDDDYDEDDELSLGTQVPFSEDENEAPTLNLNRSEDDNKGVENHPIQTDGNDGNDDNNHESKDDQKNNHKVEDDYEDDDEPSVCTQLSLEDYSNDDYIANPITSMAIVPSCPKEEEPDEKPRRKKRSASKSTRVTICIDD